jgi:membrane AbrB-like protein
MTPAFAVRILATHFAAGCGGAAAAAAHIPLPWMIGPLAVVAALGLTGLPVSTHKTVRDGAVLVIMTALGLTFTPEAARAAAGLLPEMVVAAIATVAIGVATSKVLMATARVDATTAFFCSVPGGPVEMAMMGERNGARVPEIAMSQLLRIVLLVVIVPTALTLSGVTGDAASVQSRIGVDFGGLALTLAISLGLALAGRRFGLATAFLLMPMGVGVTLGLTEAGLSAVPTWLSNACQVVMGTYLGAQFRREAVSAMRRFIPSAVLNVLLLTAGCAILGFLVALEAGVPWPTLILSTAPGSVTEMAITAKVLHFDVPTVTAFHVLRIFLVLATVPLVHAGLKRAGFFGSAPAVDRHAAPTSPPPGGVGERSPAE